MDLENTESENFDSLFQALAAQASELGLPDPEVVDTESGQVIRVWIDEVRTFRVFVEGPITTLIASLWPVAMVPLDELELLNVAVEESAFSIEVHVITDDDPRSEPEFWYDATAEVPSEDANEVVEDVLKDFLGVIEDSEERNGSLASIVLNQWYGAALAAASLEMASAIQDREVDPERSARMDLVIGEKSQLLLDSYSDFFDIDSDVAVATQLLDEADEHDACMLLIDCAFAQPFFPYDIAISDDDRQAGLEAIAAAVGFLDNTSVAELLETRHFEMGKQNALRDPKKAGAVAAAATAAAVAATALVVVTGGVAAGGIGAMGLTGAAATTHGLALLGGGSLAATGGLGMAGGLWIVAGTGVFAGASAVGAGRLGQVAVEAGDQAAQSELILLQTTCAWLYFGDSEKIDSVLQSLDENAGAIATQIGDELERSDSDSGRIKNLEKTLTYIDRARESIASPGYDNLDRAFKFAERSKSKMSNFTRRTKRKFS
jgi:hypothetical protein